MEKCPYLLGFIIFSIDCTMKENFRRKERAVEMRKVRDGQIERQQIAGNNAGVHGGKHTVAQNTITQIVDGRVFFFSFLVASIFFFFYFWGKRTRGNPKLYYIYSYI